MAAGLGFKTFTTGEVLTAADTNGYLMQGILVFASAAARDAAITSPQEGQCCYLKDTDAVQTYSGSVWVGFDDSNAIQNSIVDAKGDIVAASGNDTPARLAVGNNGETLVADSAAATGLRYQAPVAVNPVINGALDIWQRGTSINVALGWVYTSDRWQGIAGSGTWTFARESTIVPTTSQYSMKITSGGTSTFNFGQIIETANSLPYVNKTVTISSKVASSASIPLDIQLFYSTSTDASIAGTWVQITPTSGGSATPTNSTFVNLSGVFAVPSTAKTLNVRINPPSNMTSGQIVYIGEIQLEVGSVATPFKRSGGTIQGELAACQRYYYRVTPSVTNGAFSVGNNYSTTINTSVIYPKVTLRTTPTLETSGTASNYRVNTAGTGFNCSAVPVIDQTSTDIIALNATVASGLTVGNAGILIAVNGGTSILAFSSEL